MRKEPYDVAKEEMGRPIKRQFLDFNIPSTTQGHLRTSLKNIIFL